jgi:hypothetical protein
MALDIQRELYFALPEDFWLLDHFEPMMARLPTLRKVLGRSSCAENA